MDSKIVSEVEMTSEYYELHKDEIRKRQKEYYENNKSFFAEKNKKWREDNKEKVVQYRENKKELRKEQGKAWREKNKEHLASKMREYRKTKPEIIRRTEQKRNRSKEQRMKFNEYHKVWRKNNPDKLTQYTLNRRARKNDNSDLTDQEIIAQRELQNGLCHYCGLPLDNKGRGHVEHKTPLSRGGRNTKSNIVISCSKCNLEKGMKTEEEYIEHLINRSGQYSISVHAN